MNAAPAPAKKAAGKAVTVTAAPGETKAKARKPAKEPAVATPAPQKPEPHVKKEVEADAVAKTPPSAPKARRQVLTASEQRMLENKPAGATAHPEPAATSSPTPVPPAAPAVKPAGKPAENLSATVADDAALAAQQLRDKIVVIKPPIIVKDLAA